MIVIRARSQTLEMKKSGRGKNILRYFTSFILHLTFWFVTVRGERRAEIKSRIEYRIQPPVLFMMGNKR
jgi:hypothetical protein